MNLVPAQIGIVPVLDAAFPVVEDEIALVGSDDEDRMSFTGGGICRRDPQSARRPAHRDQPAAFGQSEIFAVAAGHIHLPDVTIQFVAGVVPADHRTIDGGVDVLQLQHLLVRHRNDRQTIVVAAFGRVLGAEQHLGERRNDRAFFRDITDRRTAGQAAGKTSGTGGKCRACIACCKGQSQKCNDCFLHLLNPRSGQPIEIRLAFFLGQWHGDLMICQVLGAEYLSRFCCLEGA
ncbi:conserved hypothetical protein [Rhizobium johnstonii 3841]|uniref:Uncharacterized protein n=1 Tax=Rhizobium johnstonii (strain DSM 114642 / LMG 32736 / 3841) TaxID=216596 RepID=Q1MD24_RHIJ3|nr:conserved hypothetical protein [Rhizobium johnstonii 3841]